MQLKTKIWLLREMAPFLISNHIFSVDFMSSPFFVHREKMKHEEMNKKASLLLLAKDKEILLLKSVS